MAEIWVRVSVTQWLDKWCAGLVEMPTFKYHQATRVGTWHFGDTHPLSHERHFHLLVRFLPDRHQQLLNIRAQTLRGIAAELQAQGSVDANFSELVESASADAHLAAAFATTATSERENQRCQQVCALIRSLAFATNGPRDLASLFADCAQAAEEVASQAEAPSMPGDQELAGLCTA
eukprot:7127300-Prymnesium_polylepis.1